MSGTVPVSDPFSSHWTIAGTGDFNGDKSDILLQTTASGHLTEWLMDGTTRPPGSGAVSANPGTAWHVAQ